MIIVKLVLNQLNVLYVLIAHFLLLTVIVWLVILIKQQLGSKMIVKVNMFFFN
jgi:hypothetical protein